MVPSPDTTLADNQPAQLAYRTDDLRAALEWLDQRLEAAVAVGAQIYGANAAADPYRGLAIADDEPARLLAREPGFSLLYAEHPAWPDLGAGGRLARLIALFDLSPFETALLTIALAPEIDLRYERLYAYLQDDVTKRWPSVDLALNLLCPDLEAKLAARSAFAANATLIRRRLLRIFADPALPNPPLPGQYLRVDAGLAHYLLGADGLDPALLPYARLSASHPDLDELLLPADLRRRLLLLAGGYGASSTGPLIYFQGPYGVGKRTAAGALCRACGMGLLQVDGERLLAAEGADFEHMVRLALREAALQHAALYWAGFDTLLAVERHAERDLLLRALSEQRGPSFLAGETLWEPRDTLADLPFVRVELAPPGYTERAALWARALAGGAAGAAHAVADDTPEALAAKFLLSGGQIRDAAATARSLALRRNPERPELTADDLAMACRLHSNRRLTELAQKISPHYGWDDIVLPEDCMRQLREICNCVSYRPLVYGAWGFERRLALGKGLNVLFAGPSGTGKTMAAEIIANDLGLELYKIDLATVVSKYIGETEKNLARIFAEAESSNAILFFDEADALFGKRSEVRDAHDRYANVEIAYLLQRMEEYAGITILATNLRKNMDEAFVRRLQFIVEFPFPSPPYRRQIWERIWPAGIPRSADVDLEFLAKRCEIAGGNIRNIALAAAFLAAADGQVVTMPHLIHATRREYQKMGRVVGEGEFG
jgi:SpoVK/Ycf46/Vps4 family AAA+-type ATPase